MITVKTNGKVERLRSLGFICTDWDKYFERNYAAVSLVNKTFSTEEGHYYGDLLTLKEFEGLVAPRTFPSPDTISERIEVVKSIRFYHFPKELKIEFINDPNCVLEARDGSVRRRKKWYHIF